MKEQLVEMTGLSPRVIRVWFQNKRCKDKKKANLMKQLQQQHHSDKTVSVAIFSALIIAHKIVKIGYRLCRPMCAFASVFFSTDMGYQTICRPLVVCRPYLYCNLETQWTPKQIFLNSDYV